MHCNSFQCEFYLSSWFSILNLTHRLIEQSEKKTWLASCGQDQECSDPQQDFPPEDWYNTELLVTPFSMISSSVRVLCSLQVFSLQENTEILNCYSKVFPGIQYTSKSVTANMGSSLMWISFFSTFVPLIQALITPFSGKVLREALLHGTSLVWLLNGCEYKQIQTFSYSSRTSRIEVKCLLL